MSVNARSCGDSISWRKSTPPDRTAGKPKRVDPGVHPLGLQIVGLFGGQLGRVDQHGGRDTAGRHQVGGVAGQQVGLDETGVAGGQRPDRVGVGDPRLVADVQHVGGDVQVTDVVAARAVVVQFDVDLPRWQQVEP